ncbi:MAG: alpha/beta hydrolase family protein [Planctomycetaceae bacterium]
MNSAVSTGLTTCVLLLLTPSSFGQPAPHEGSPEFLSFIQTSAKQLRSGETAPASEAAWKQDSAKLRTQLLQAWGGFPEHPTDLEPRVLETLQRDGYHIEKLIFQTLPDVWMTANAYVPEADSPVPAVLCVHGHWKGAKQDPHVQARCIGLAKLGFFVLAVDAFGAGERAIGKALGEYHGEMTAATLLPVGRPLSGIQVYENQRAVDYLLTRPEVDGSRIGITGASGGGNQTMYAGAWDERFRAVVPVCSVGNYQAYLGAACCMCEVIPGALAFTEEWGVLSLTAPRALMVVNATRDARQFSVAEAAKSIAQSQPIFDLLKTSDRLRHAVFESPHDYNQEMREAMYGWMTRFLKGTGDGSPISEPALETEDPETLRCFPGESRPDSWLTLPQFAAIEARKVLAAHDRPQDATAWEAHQAAAAARLHDKVLGNTDPTAPSQLQIQVAEEPTPPNAGAPLISTRHVQFSPEPGIKLSAVGHFHEDRQAAEIAFLIHPDGGLSPDVRTRTQELLVAGTDVVICELRACGRHSVARDQVGHAADHNSAEWSLWLGRPLLGQWVKDVRNAIRACRHQFGLPTNVKVIGYGAGGTIALCAAALDPAVTQVEVINSLATYVTDVPYRNQRLGLLAPGILRDVGDIPDIAALIAPRKLTITAPVSPVGKVLTEAEAKAAFSETARVYNNVLNSPENFQLRPTENDSTK